MSTVDAPSAPPSVGPANSFASPRAAVWRAGLLLAGVAFCDTLIDSFVGEKSDYLLKDQLALTATGLATFGLIQGLGGYLRPLFGVLFDFVPLLGYHRRSYFVLSALLEFFTALPLAWMHQYTYAAVLTCFLFATMGWQMIDVTTQAIAVRVGNQTGQVQRLQTIESLVPALITITFGAHLSGYVAQRWSYHAVYLAALAATLALLPLVFLIDERPVVRNLADESVAARMERRQERREDRQAAWLALREGARSQGFWVVVAFVFYLGLTPGYTSAWFYFENDGLHFSKQLIGSLGAWQSFGAIVGYLIFGALSPKLPLRAIVWSIVGTTAGEYAVNLLIHDRTSAAGALAISSFAGAFGSLGIMTMAARACPPRVEAIVFGTFLAVLTLGSDICDVTGSAIYTHFGRGQAFTRGWDALNLAGVTSGVVAAAFIPFLPKWARSSQTYVEQTREGKLNADTTLSA